MILSNNTCLKLFPPRGWRNDCWWNTYLGANIRSNHSRLDSYWGRGVDKSQFGYQGECATCESELYILTSCHKSNDWASKGIQRCIFLDIQRLERYTTKNCITLNQTRHHNTTCSSNKVPIESQLCFHCQARYKQVTYCWFY
jgi:hypothetical protein